MMKSNWLVWLLLAALLAGCGQGGTDTPTPTLTRTPTEAPETETPETETPDVADTPTLTPTATQMVTAGTVRPETDLVKIGRTLDALEAIAGNVPFFEGDVIDVDDGGEAVLEFGERMVLRVFNNSGVIIGEVSESETSIEMRIVLERGGLTGELSDGSGTAIIETPGGAEITITGTEFFVVYEEETEQTVVGNFEGSLEYEGSVTDRQELPNGKFVVIPDNEPGGLAGGGDGGDGGGTGGGTGGDTGGGTGGGTDVGPFARATPLAFEVAASNAVFLRGAGEITMSPQDFAAYARTRGSAQGAAFELMFRANLYCGDGVCTDEIGESVSTCALDCGYCGDDVCSADLGETANTCFADCGVVIDFNLPLSSVTLGFCGDGVCATSSGENALTCAADC